MKNRILGLINKLNKQDQCAAEQLSLIQTMIFAEHLRCCLVAGLSIPTAFFIATESLKKGEVKAMLQKTAHSLQIGLSLRQALKVTTQNCQLRDLVAVLDLLTATIQNGSSCESSLQLIKEQAWSKVVDVQMEQISQTPVKLLLPITLFLLPSVILILCAQPIAKLLGDVF